MSVQFPSSDNTRLTPKAAAARQLGMELLEQKTNGCAKQALVGSPPFARMLKQVERFDKQVAEYTESMMQVLNNGAINLKDELPAGLKSKMEAMDENLDLKDKVLKKFTDRVIDLLKSAKNSERGKVLQNRAIDIIDTIDAENQLPDAATRAIHRILDARP